MSIVKQRTTLNRKIRSAKKVFLMAHKDLDLDALGSSIGMYVFLKRKRKECYIIVDDINHELGVEKVLRELEGCIKIIKSHEGEKYQSSKKSQNLLMILDTNKTELLQNKELSHIK